MDYSEHLIGRSGGLMDNWIHGSILLSHGIVAL